MSVFKFFKFFIVILSISALLSGCSSLPKIKKPDWSKGAIEPNAMKRAQSNAREGKGIQLFKSKKGRVIQTLLLQIDVIIHHKEANLVNLFVRRSFSEHLMSWIKDAASRL